MGLSLLQRRARLPFAFQPGDVLEMEGFMRGIRTLEEVYEPDRDGDQVGGFVDVPIFAVQLVSRWRVSPRIVSVTRYGEVTYRRAASPVTPKEEA